MKVLAIAGAVLLGALLIFLGASGARYLAPAEGDGGAVEVTPAAATTTPAVSSGTLDLQTITELLAVLDANRRNQIIDSKENFEKFVTQETLNQSVLAAAYGNGADQNEAIRVLMERAGQRVLAEAYLNQVVRLNLPKDFPSEEQVREAYDKNPTVFRVPRRIHLWQIFLPLSPDADNDASKAAWKLADTLVGQLRKGQSTFEEVAKKHSGHTASRVSDGYMGLINMAELLPPIADAALALKEGGISDPIATDTGLHILKRGAIVEEEHLDFESIKPNIRQRLVREAAIKVRQAAVEKISEEFPVEAPQADLESWRNELRERAAAPAPAAAASGDG